MVDPGVDVGDLVAPLIGARRGRCLSAQRDPVPCRRFQRLRFSGHRNKIVTDAMHFPSILYLIDRSVASIRPDSTSFPRTMVSPSVRMSSSTASTNKRRS